MARPSKATLRRRAKAAPRYTSGPKKGQFKPRGAAKRRRKKTAAKKTTTRRRRKRTTAAAPRKRRTTRRAAPRKSAKRSAAAKKAARTKAANARKRSLAGKKAARTRKRRGNPGSTAATNPRRRRRKARRNPVARRRKRMSVATRKKISRALKRRYRGNPGKKRRRNPVKRSKRTGKFISGGRKRKARGRLSRRSVMLAPAPRKRAKQYRLRRTKRTSKSGKGFYQYSLARANPGSQLKGPLMAGLGVFGGVLAARTMGALLAKHVLPKLLPATTSAATARWVGALLPGLSMFLLATFVAPKVIKGKPNVVRGLQMGSVVALADGAINALVASGVLPTSIAPYVQGPGVAMSGFGAFQYSQPLAEYVDYDNRLGEYVDFDNRYGGEASEPLALGSDELAYFQTGGAGGVFNKTVFNGVG